MKVLVAVVIVWFVTAAEVWAAPQITSDEEALNEVVIVRRCNSVIS
jgi:hypothetical protein